MNEIALLELIKNDPVYSQLLASCEAAEVDYIRIRAALSPEDQRLLERYISLCEEMDHRKLQLALGNA